MILAAGTLAVQNEQEIYQAVVAIRSGAGTFEDALIGALGAWWGCSATLTFDQNAAKRLNGFQLLQIPMPEACNRQKDRSGCS